MSKNKVGMERGRRLSPAAWICGGLVLVAALLVRLRAGSPLPLLHMLQPWQRMPPLWLLGLLWLAGFFLLGCAIGQALVCPAPGTRSAWRLRGLLYGLLSGGCALLWYPLLFASSLLWLSWICLLGGALSAWLCMLSLMRVQRRLGWRLLPFVLWLVFLCLLQLLLLLGR